MNAASIKARLKFSLPIVLCPTPDSIGIGKAPAAEVCCRSLSFFSGLWVCVLRLFCPNYRIAFPIARAYQAEYEMIFKTGNPLILQSSDVTRAGVSLLLPPPLFGKLILRTCPDPRPDPPRRTRQISPLPRGVPDIEALPLQDP